MAGAGTYPRLSGGISLVNGSNERIAFDEGGGAGSLVADLTAADIRAWWRGDAGAGDTAAEIDICHAIGVALGAAGGVYQEPTISSAGILTITGSQAFTLNLGHASTTITPAWLGMTAGNHVATGPVGGIWTVVGTQQITPCFYPESVYVRDTELQREQAAVLTRSMTGRQISQRWGTGRYWREILMDALPSDKIFQAEETLVGESFERFWLDVLSLGLPFEWTRDLASLPASWAGVRYVLSDAAQLQRMPIALTPNTRRRYDIGLRMALDV